MGQIDEDYSAALDRQDQLAIEITASQARIDERRPRFAASRAEHERLLTGFLGAVQAGDLEALRGMLAQDAISWSDGGGKRLAARNLVHGADAVAGVSSSGSAPVLNTLGPPVFSGVTLAQAVDVGLTGTAAAMVRPA